MSSARAGSNPRPWRLAGAATASASFTGLVGSAVAGGAAEKPFPVDRTQIVKDGVFVVEGRKRIPVGVEITIQKGTKIVGKEGKDGPGVLEVEGKLTVQGVYGAVV